MSVVCLLHEVEYQCDRAWHCHLQWVNIQDIPVLTMKWMSVPVYSVHTILQLVMKMTTKKKKKKKVIRRVIRRVISIDQSVNLEKEENNPILCGPLKKRCEKKEKHCNRRCKVTVEQWQPPLL